MTAEIAIMNRSALALAADSVATIVSPTATKRFDSAEKIFELSRDMPIALMIYNNAEFMNTPLDVLVRQFRKDQGATTFATVQEVREKFEAYIMAFDRSPTDEIEHFKQHAREVLTEISQRLSSAFFAAQSAGKKPDYTKIADAEIDGVTKRAQARHVPSCLSGVTEVDFLNDYRMHVKAVIADVFSTALSNSKVLVDQFTVMMFHILRSDDRSEGFTGFVFGGFGSTELFPAIHWIECDGIYCGKLRILMEDKKAIDRHKATSEIVGFAQKEMPERFISGLDARFEREITKIAEGILDQIAAQRPRTFGKTVGKQIIDLAKRRFGRGLEQLKRDSEIAVRSMVDFMSKKDLAEMAHSLVEITSRKRRFSDEEESVGGPIDVAILTKSEGFIWISRKHYFDADKNPGYFSRQFGVGGTK